MMRVPASKIEYGSDDRFDTASVVATINRLLAEGGVGGAGEVVGLTVIGHVAAEPARLRIITKMLFKKNNCIVAIPAEVDAGALKGLEAGIAAD